MMLIATGLAVALASAAPAQPAPVSLAPVVITIVESGVPAAVVSRLLEETDAVWRTGGVSFQWQRGAREAASLPPGADMGPWLPASRLRVIIGNDTGVSRDHRTPLGWIVFDAENTPQQEIYLSYRNAWSLMAASGAVVGSLNQMPVLRRQILLARAMGRALAHEIAHYLLASKVHTRRGLLRASRTASELFSNDRAGFRIDTTQRQQIAAAQRLRGWETQRR